MITIVMSDYNINSYLFYPKRFHRLSNNLMLQLTFVDDLNYHIHDSIVLWFRS